MKLFEDRDYKMLEDELFGYSKGNPILTMGPIGEVNYLSNLETLNGERLLFHCLGAIKTIDVFEAVSFSGENWFLFFMDLYHSQQSKQTPLGFRFTKNSVQFSGIHVFCKNFPFDFAKMNYSEKHSNLNKAYINMSCVIQKSHDPFYQRPMTHNAKLDLIMPHLFTTDT